MSDTDMPTWMGVMLIVLAVALWMTIILFALWRWRAWRRGEGFVVEIREDYRGGLPDSVHRRLVSADGWMGGHPIVPAVLNGAVTGFVLATFFSAWVGVVGGAVTLMLGWLGWGRRRQRAPLSPAAESNQRDA